MVDLIAVLSGLFRRSFWIGVSNRLFCLSRWLNRAAQPQQIDYSKPVRGKKRSKAKRARKSRTGLE